MFYFLSSEKFGHCGTNKVYDLAQGLDFVRENYGKKLEFTTAVNEMTISILSKMGSAEVPPFCTTVVDTYAKLLNN